MVHQCQLHIVAFDGGFWLPGRIFGWPLSFSAPQLSKACLVPDRAVSERDKGQKVSSLPPDAAESKVGEWKPLRWSRCSSDLSLSIKVNVVSGLLHWKSLLCLGLPWLISKNCHCVLAAKCSWASWSCLLFSSWHPPVTPLTFTWCLPRLLLCSGLSPYPSPWLSMHF